MGGAALLRGRGIPPQLFLGKLTNQIVHGVAIGSAGVKQ